MRRVEEPRRVVERWPDPADAQKSLVYSGRLPELDVRGRPSITASCKHHPRWAEMLLKWPCRTSIDLLGPLLHEWQKLEPHSMAVCAIVRRFLPTMRLKAEKSLRLLVMDGSGRLTRHLEDLESGMKPQEATTSTRFIKIHIKNIQEFCRNVST